MQTGAQTGFLSAPRARAGVSAAAQTLTEVGTYTLRHTCSP